MAPAQQITDCNPDILGSGSSYLKEQTFCAEKSSLSSTQKQVLKRMLSAQNLQLEGRKSVSLPQVHRHSAMDLKIVDTTMSDETILQAARQVPSSMSLLGSILRVLDDGGNVAAKAILKTCALSVQPGMVPAVMDAKEMVLAALQFLSCTAYLPFGSKSVPALPWIRPLQEVNDLEKRVYEKAVEWSFVDILPVIPQLEDVFYNTNTADIQWLPRARFCPSQMPKVERDLLLLKGTAPTSTAKVKRKRNRVTVPPPKNKKIATSDEVAPAATAISAPKDDVPAGPTS